MMTTDAATIGTAHNEAVEHPDTVAIQTFGFWIYLMSDLIIFATLFATFAVLGRNYANGPTGKELFDLPYLLGETLFLLFSSVNLWSGHAGRARRQEEVGADRTRRYLAAGARICLHGNQ